VQEETRQHLDYLDGWRGLAIVTVLLGHFWLDALRPGVSALGVAFFFVLSGRLMAEILFLRQTRLPVFFARRFSRVYPGLLCFVVLVSLGFRDTPYVHDILSAFSALTFTLNYVVIYVEPIALMDHVWSLCVEEHGYIVLAAVALAVRRWHWPAAPVMLVCGAAAVANAVLRTDVFGQPHVHVFWRSDVQVAPIFLAAGLFLLLRERRDSLWTRPWIAPAALLLGGALRLSGADVALSFGLGNLLLALAVATLDSSLAALRNTFSAPPLRLFGIWSFSIYLWQQPFYKLAHHGFLSVVLALLGGCAAGLASFYLVEGPARAFLNRRWPPVAARLQPGLPVHSRGGEAH